MEIFQYVLFPRANELANFHLPHTNDQLDDPSLQNENNLLDLQSNVKIAKINWNKKQKLTKLFFQSYVCILHSLNMIT